MVQRPIKAAEESPTRRTAKTIADAAEAAVSGPPELPRDPRQPSDWALLCGGVSWSLHFEPSPRDVRQWRVYRNGEPWMCAGLQRVWRAMQKEMAPVLGRRHWR